MHYVHYDLRLTEEDGGEETQRGYGGAYVLRQAAQEARSSRDTLHVERRTKLAILTLDRSPE